MIRAALLWLVLAAAAAAQTYPAHRAVDLNDLAGVLAPEAADRIAALVRAARTDPGVEMTVVTIARVADHAPGMTLEAFATGLFNAWGIGDRAADDGILILVAVEDRAVRIELGDAYPPVYDGRALRVIDVLMLPAFRAGDIAGGIAAGVTGAVEHIARPFRAGAAVTETGGIGPDPARDAPLVWIAAAVAGLLGALGWFGARARRPRCPACGSRDLILHEAVLDPPAASAAGRGIRRRQCASCGWRAEEPYAIPTAAEAGLVAAAGAAGAGEGTRGGTDDRDDGGGSFGGGSSGGGGASGRW